MPEQGEEEVTSVLRAQAERAGQLEVELASVRESAAQELRAAVVAGRPDLPAELLTGGTAEELRASVARAEGVVSAIRESALEDVRNMAAGKRPIGFRPPVKAGSAPAGPPEGVRGLDRIRFGLENEGGK